MTSIRDLEGLQQLATAVRGTPFLRFGGRLVSRGIETLAWLTSGSLVVLDVVLASVGHAAYIAEESVGEGGAVLIHSITDRNLRQVFPFVYGALALGAVLLALMALQLRATRKREADVRLLCDGIAKLRAPSSSGVQKVDVGRPKIVA